VPTPPPRPAAHASFGCAQSVSAEGYLEAPPYLVDVHTDCPQSTCRIGGGIQRWSDVQQLGTRGGQVEAARVQ
jgi:hypothetical protein